MMGGAIARDLLETDEQAQVTLLDCDEARLTQIAEKLSSSRLRQGKLDVTDTAATAKALQDHAVAISALPHGLSLAGIEAGIRAGVCVVDLVGEAPEERAALGERARAAGVLVVPGCGVAPGISNICVGRGVELLDETESAVIYVGGIPKRKRPPLQYETVFLLESVFNSYLRPVHAIKGGKPVILEPLSGLESIEFPEPIGTLEAFHADGLASLLLTLGDQIAGDLVEKTMRYPGHVERVRFLSECGLLGREPVTCGGIDVVPLELLTEALSPRLELGPEGDILVMRVVVEGTKGGVAQRHVFELIDYFDPVSGNTAMARTTGFPAACAARMIASGAVTERGVFFPEQLFAGDHYAAFIAELLAKGVSVTHTVQA
jgi:lysine 6-dehydrogenase